MGYPFMTFPFPLSVETTTMSDKLSPAEQALRDAARDYHRYPTRGKISVNPTKPMSNQRDLSLAYSPGVAYPCLDIAADPSKAHEYTSRGNLVAVITNGTAVLGLLPKMAALVESLPTFVLGGAGLVMFGMVAATGIRILGGVDFKNNRFNAMIVAISIGIGMIPLIAPNFKQWMPHGLHPLIESGILLASISAVALNLFFNGASGDNRDAIEAAKQAEAH